MCGGNIDKKGKRTELLPPIVRLNVATTRASATVGVEKQNSLVKISDGSPKKKKKGHNGKNEFSTKAKKTRQSSLVKIPDESPKKKKKSHHDKNELSTTAKKTRQRKPQELSVTALSLNTPSSILPQITSLNDVKPYAIKGPRSTHLDDNNTNTVDVNADDADVSKRVRSVNSLKAVTAFLNSAKSLRSDVSSDGTQKLSTKNFGTQTYNLTPVGVNPTPTIIANGAVDEEERPNTPKATQTDKFVDVLNSFPTHKIKDTDDIEQRSKLLEVVDEALDQTIDKNSRHRVNELIASSARKQAEVWKDVKDFVSGVLIPQSIAIANKAQSKQGST